MEHSHTILASEEKASTTKHVWLGNNFSSQLMDRTSLTPLGKVPPCPPPTPTPLVKSAIVAIYRISINDVWSVMKSSFSDNAAQYDTMGTLRDILWDKACHVTKGHSQQLPACNRGLAVRPSCMTDISPVPKLRLMDLIRNCPLPDMHKIMLLVRHTVDFCYYS